MQHTDPTYPSASPRRQPPPGARHGGTASRAIERVSRRPPPSPLIAHAAVAHALEAPMQDTAQSTTGPELPGAPAPVTTDMSMDPDAYNDHLPGEYTPSTLHWRLLWMVTTFAALP